MVLENCMQKSYANFSRVAEIVEIILLSLGVFLTPLVIPQILSFVFGEDSFLATNSQFVVGAIVNTSLILGGINLKGWKKVLAIVFLPSISALFSGFVLKISAIYTVYMIPAIWIGNFALVYLFKLLFVSKKVNYIFTSIAAIIVKCAFIFAGYQILLQTNIIPQGSKVAQAMFASMGLNQVITASIGAVIAFAFIKLLYPHLNSKKD